MFGCEMKFQLFENSASFFWWKCLVQSSWFMRAEIIENNTNNQNSIRIKHIHQPFHAFCKINHRMLLCDTNIPFTCQGFIKHIQIPDTLALVLIIIALLATCFTGVSLPSFFNQLFLPFIITNLGILGIIGTFVLIENVFHTSHIFRTGLRNAPHFFLPRLYLVFLAFGG